tara:strand:+ start:135 stop:350 length:216 start_codon:yes stop_codon:yes gene_type:complete
LLQPDFLLQGHGNHLHYIAGCTAEKVMLQFVWSYDEPVLPSSFDDKELEDLTVDEIASGLPEYSLWDGRDC